MEYGHCNCDLLRSEQYSEEWPSSILGRAIVSSGHQRPSETNNKAIISPPPLMCTLSVNNTPGLPLMRLLSADSHRKPAPKLLIIGWWDATGRRPHSGFETSSYILTKLRPREGSSGSLVLILSSSPLLTLARCWWLVSVSRRGGLWVVEEGGRGDRTYLLQLWGSTLSAPASSGSGSGVPGSGECLPVASGHQ